MYQTILGFQRVLVHPQIFQGMEANPVPLKGFVAPTDLQPYYSNGVFGNAYLLALDNTKSETLPVLHCRNGS